MFVDAEWWVLATINLLAKFTIGQEPQYSRRLEQRRQGEFFGPVQAASHVVDIRHEYQGNVLGRNAVIMLLVHVLQAWAYATHKLD